MRTLLLERIHRIERLESPGSKGRSPLRGAMGGAAVVLLGLLASGPAHASSVFAISARPERVIFEPGPPETADRVQIQGLIAVAPMPSTGVDFGPLSCGYMYFKCAAGEEALCREQWQDLAAAAAAGKCVMFSARRDSMGVLIDQGRVRPFSEAAAAPDTFVAREGLGVSTVICAGDLLAECPLPSSGAGGAGGGAGAGGGGRSGGAAGGAGGGSASGPGGSPAGASGTAGAPATAGHAGTAGAIGSGGASSSGGAGGTAGAPAAGGGGGASLGGGSGSGGAPAVLDGGTDAPSGRKGGGCSLAAETGGTSGLLGLLSSTALAFALFRARRRQERSGRRLRRGRRQ